MLTSVLKNHRYFGRSPTSVTSESNVRIGESAMPWERNEDDGNVYKYQYHPHGDKNQPLRNAPSALNTVIVPNVTLPKVRYPVDLSSPGASLDRIHPKKGMSLMLMIS